MPTIDSFHRSDPGQKRANNEDAAGALEPKDARQLRRSGRLYIVADGLGGHQMGEQASAQIVETLLKVYYEAPDIPPEKRLRDIIQQVNRNLVAARKDLAAGEKTATTVVAAVVRSGALLLASVGDSRAYLLRDGEMRQITRDHSFVGEMMRAGAITEAEAQQSKYRNRLTRSVGGGEANLEVDIYPPIPLQPGDLILLCTDGLTQYATTEDLLAAASYGSAREIVERLVRFANTRGGSDNITASVIKYGKKSAIPVLPVKTLAAVGAGLLMLAVLVSLGWYVFIGRPAASASTPTPTASLIPTATLFASPTPELTQTLTLIPIETPLPDTPVPIPPPINALIKCQYIVKPGNMVSKLAVLFNVNEEQITWEDGSRDNMSLIYPGDILIINDISIEVCTNNGGTVQPPTQ